MDKIEKLKLILITIFILWALRLFFLFDAYIDSFFMSILAIMIYISDYGKK